MGDSVNSVRVGGAPQKINEQSNLQLNQIGIETNKFDEDYLLIQNNPLVHQNNNQN